jgi:nicotinate-nucleotide adenylyltransferase
VGEPLTEDELLGGLAALAVRGVRPVLGIVGGTFDPPHRGHVELGRALERELAADALLYLPAGNPSFKQGRTHVPAAERARLVELAVRGAFGVPCAVSLREVERPGVTYTADTLRELRLCVPAGTRLVYAVGTDAFATLPLWYEARAVARGAEFALFSRDGDDAAAALAAVRAQGLDPQVHLMRARVPGFSSTAVRSALAAGDPAARGALPSAVAAYVAEHGLYRAD